MKSDPNVFNEYVTEFIKTVRGKSLNTLKKYRTGSSAFMLAFIIQICAVLDGRTLKNTEFGFCLIAERYKNQNAFIDPVHKFPLAIQILERQNGKDSEYVFPGAISEQKYNDKLKDLATLAGINKRLMNKTAWHSAIQFWEARGLETQHMVKWPAIPRSQPRRNTMS